MLCSGGLDSTVCMAIAAREVGIGVALSFDYGQRHVRELESARAVARHYGADQLVVRLDATDWGGSALTDPSFDVPRARDSLAGVPAREQEAISPGHASGGELVGARSEARAGPSEIPITYVPGRNTIFLAVAIAVAEARDLDVVYLGVNALDYSGYPDCRPRFVDAFRTVAALGTKRGIEGRPVEISAPLIELRKVEIVQLGLRLLAPLELSWSCYEGASSPCGVCEACVLRQAAFDHARVADPACVHDPGSPGAVGKHSG